MILLDGHSLTQAGWIGNVNSNLIIKERDCTAAWTPQTLEGIGTDSWLKDDTRPGAGIVWRVQNIRQVFGTDIHTINLEHVINTLKDKILFGEIGPEQITGTTGATTCTARQAVEYILSKSSDWTLGDFDYDSVSNPYKFDGETLYEALEKVTDTLTDPWWSFNTTVYPFEINITQEQTGVGTELRANRNLMSIEKTIDRNGMYTRFYPVGKDDLHITGNCVEKNINIYGEIEKEEVDQSLTTEAELIAWANERLNRHAEPVVNIVVDGLELSDATGEQLDNIRHGMLCQVPLPEYGTVIRERIIEMNYPDAENSPEVVKITLANNREDVTKIIADAIKSGGKGRKAAAKKGKEDHAWFEDTNNHVAMCAEGIVGVDAQGNPNWTRLSQIIVNENGIDATVQSIQNDNELAWTAIHQNEDAIELEAQRATDAEGSLGSSLEISAGKINQVVTAVGSNGEVTAASICIAINSSGDSNATINASKIYLLGQTIADTITANYISSKIASLSVLNVAAISATGNINTSNGYIMAPYYYLGVAGNARNLATSIWALRITQSGNTYTLQKQDYDDSDWVDVGNFSRATTLSAQWDGNRKFTVGASPQGVSRYTTLMSAVPNANVTWNGTVGTIALKATIDDGETAIDVGNITMDVANFLQNKTSTNKFTANGTYTAGQGYLGFGQIEIDVPQSSGAQNVEVRFNGSSGSYYIEAFDSVSGNPITGANLTYKMALNGTKVEIQNTSGTKIGADYQVPLQSSRTITSNGTYTPSSGNIGIASVTVNVPSDLPNAKARFNVSSGQYYIEAFDNVSTNPIGGSSVSYKLGFSGTKVQIQNTSGTRLNNTPEMTLGINSGSVNSAGSRTLTVTAGGSDTTATTTITDYASGWSAARGKLSIPTASATAQYITVKYPASSVGGQDTTYYYVTADNTYAYIKLTNASGTTVARVSHSAYSNGQNAVSINAPTWSTSPASGISVDNNTATFKTNAPTQSSRQLKILLGKDSSFSSNKLYVYAYHTSATASYRIARIQVDASSVYSAGVTEGEGHGNYLVPVWGERAGDNYNANAYSASGGTWIKKIYASGSTGVHIPLSENGADMNSANLTEIPAGGVTANGNYKFRSGTAGIRYFSVNVPTTSHNVSVTSNNNWHGYNRTDVLDRMGISSFSYEWGISSSTPYWGFKATCGSSSRYFLVYRA